MKLVFLGPPGAGKGTQAVRVAQKLEIFHASTGDIFRTAVKSGSELGKTVQAFLDAGTLVPDAVTCRVVEREVLAKRSDYVLDGFPRTLVQAELLSEALEKREESLDAVVFYELGDEQAIKRLTGRLVCRKCGWNYHRETMPPKEEGVCDECGGELYVRSDSTREAVEARLAEYHEKTEPLVSFYERQGLLRRIDASKSFEAVSSKTLELIGSLT
jgi:adenylate kinase